MSYENQLFKVEASDQKASKPAVKPNTGMSKNTNPYWNKVARQSYVRALPFAMGIATVTALLIPNSREAMFSFFEDVFSSEEMQLLGLSFGLTIVTAISLLYYFGEHRPYKKQQALDRENVS